VAAVGIMYLNPRIVGCGERTLVLSHGYGGSQAIWDKVLPHLSRTNKVRQRSSLPLMILAHLCMAAMSSIDPSA